MKVRLRNILIPVLSVATLALGVYERADPEPVLAGEYNREDIALSERADALRERRADLAREREAQQEMTKRAESVSRTLSDMDYTFSDSRGYKPFAAADDASASKNFDESFFKQFTRPGISQLELHMIFLERLQTDEWRAKPEHEKVAHALALDLVENLLIDRLGRPPMTGDWGVVIGQEPNPFAQGPVPHLIPYESLESYLYENWQEKE